MHEIIRRPFSFQGRITRKTFWLANILLWIASYALVILLTIFIALLLKSPSGDVPQAILSVASIIILLLFVAISIASLFIYAALVIKRAHDRNSSGWLWLFGTFLLFIPWIILGLLPGNNKPNEYGSKRY
jgi:uncharacterized membrane protein YhaH (DUF805 family)